MKAIIIDDEKKGRETLLKLLANYCKEVLVVAMASNASEGYELINEHHPDIVFLDIEMPGGDGFSLLEKFDEIKFQTVFTTAFDHYAVKAIKFHALDYLLKPIDIDELRIAVENAKKLTKTKNTTERYTYLMESHRTGTMNKLALPVKEGIIYLTVSDIIRVESDGSYSTFFTSDGKKNIVSKNLGEYEEILPLNHFFRAHKSHLINIKKVKKYLRTDGNFIEMEDGSTVEVARRKKDEFLQLMSELN